MSSFPVEMEPKQRRAYEAMRDDAIVQLNSGRFLMANGRLAEMTRLKQLSCAHGKMVKSYKQKMVGGKLQRVEQMSFQPSLPSCKWDWIKNVFLAERGILDNDGEHQRSLSQASFVSSPRTCTARELTRTQRSNTS
jgi:hypothetical protein